MSRAILAAGGFFLSEAESGGGGGGSPPPVILPLPPPQKLVQEPDWKKEAEEARKAAAALEARLAERENSQKSVEETLLGQVNELKAFTARQKAEYEENQRRQAAYARQMELTGYRERLLREFGEHIPVQMHGQVFGETETDIYNSALVTAKAAAQLQMEFENRIRARLFPQGAPQEGQTPGIAPGGIPQIPRNPHYVQAQQGQGGFPRVVNSTAPQETEIDISGLTGEAAVRSGKYAESRENILRALQRGQVPSQTVPQTASPLRGMPQQQLPDGATRPLPAPMGTQFSSPQQAAAFVPPPPPAHAQGQFQQGVAQAQQGGDLHAQAVAAIQRTRSGQNPVAGQQGPGFQDQVRMMQGQQGADGVAAYQGRFTDSPPISQ